MTLCRLEAEMRRNNSIPCRFSIADCADGRVGDIEMTASAASRLSTKRPFINDTRGIYRPNGLLQNVVDGVLLSVGLEAD